jgi:DNA-directed RNA polymerase specialized sigma subunit
LNPIDEALEALQSEGLEKEGFAKPTSPLSPRAQRELQMWHDWNNSGKDPNKLRPLLSSLQPLVKNRMRLFEHNVRDIPPSAIQSEFQDQLLGALETYQPGKAKLNTWISTRLKKANRFISTYQNPGRIGEKRTGQIAKFQNVESLLTQEFGRRPTEYEIADHAQMPVGDVRKLQTEIRKSFPSGHFGSASPATITPSRTNEILELLPHDLTSDEAPVFEYVFGRGGKPKLGTGAIAKKLGMSAPKISRIKKSIADKWRQYEDG